MDELVKKDMPPLSNGYPQGQINDDSWLLRPVTAPYFSQRNVESGYSRVSRDPLGCPPLAPKPTPASKPQTPLIIHVGKKEKSGFVRNASNLQNLGLNFDHPERFLSSYNREFCNGGLLKDKRLEDRGSVMMSAPHGLQESGFTRSSRNPLACPLGVSHSPHARTQMAASVPKVQILSRKELSGFVRNLPSIQTLEDTVMDRFLTHYQSTYCHAAGFRMNG
ncbi:hypothetical protein GJAV_G00231860 [Gymnothorax javanicus]|nr:hypothetical protein GJAV_G00231860 [Gymnothorax javanicus]